MESKILSTNLTNKLFFFLLASIVYLSEQKYFMDPFIDYCKKNLYHRPARRDCFRWFSENITEKETSLRTLKSGTTLLELQ